MYKLVIVVIIKQASRTHMSFLAVNPLDPKAHWITPERQLGMLHLPIAQEVSEVSPLIFDLANIVAEYATSDAWVTNWYKAHSLLGTLPAKVPPLPRHIDQILDSKCPIYSGQ